MDSIDECTGRLWSVVIEKNKYVLPPKYLFHLKRFRQNDESYLCSSITSIISPLKISKNTLEGHL